MIKKTIVTLTVFAFIISLAGFATHSFAETNHSSAIVGVVTEINGTTLSVLARDNNTYTVNAGDAKVVKGFLGFWAKPSAFSNIEVTDTLTIKGDIDGTTINATEIADNKTPKNIQTEARSKQTPSILDTVINAVTGGTTTTPDISSSTSSTIATSTDVNTESEASTTATTTSIIENVINTVGDTIQNIVNTVTGTSSSSADNSTGEASATTTGV